MDCFSPSDKLFMHQALSEGRRALPACLPNPPVGCVLVRNGQIIARGFTQAPGQPHAEAMAMTRFVGDADGVTAYVTLEPCSFHGRTPSCANALIERGIQRVFVAMLDPDPRNAGAGIRRLEEAGVEVHLGLLQAQAAGDLGRYLNQSAGAESLTPGLGA
ncbi:bifunctional diaminohydroxyphosphoribosylaminopyrimidine deaminase/5-amino-6-(5-phosphoribosylamino)uracil reductase RibD [Pseudomonas tructae]|uniref:diaminohydroxyphosphoribosylaminopyrimidine deaminase n=1 Tax=Pseudomonas tructae TaxID=2518644 RepID=A0A411MHX2_9PSED|nr:bifunctional diaminohydroxyphosphoribosylaminopyrimidine deaminase/5-amino-6-(5-phosphoribosylamino)uracil reductase RibD [Pseudomonas tructae]QBF26310.1 bifunctional diaminohydroxyphosphoribosylaminopyrimidine deaminase/5-amino-6-(5-phosphoribosylamino)uracil reductase RibD [Pseudomonas tructae]